jgi:hypothetical protein
MASLFGYHRIGARVIPYATLGKTHKEMCETKLPAIMEATQVSKKQPSGPGQQVSPDQHAKRDAHCGSCPRWPTLRTLWPALSHRLNRELPTIGPLVVFDDGGLALYWLTPKAIAPGEFLFYIAASCSFWDV